MPRCSDADDGFGWWAVPIARSFSIHRPAIAERPWQLTMVAGPCPSKALAASCKKPGPSYARTCESPYAGVDIPHRRDIRRGDSTDSVTSHSCAGGRRYHEDANHVNHHAKEHDVNYLEHRRQHKDALWEQLREPHQAPHRKRTDKAADGIAGAGRVQVVHNS